MCKKIATLFVTHLMLVAAYSVVTRRDTPTPTSTPTPTPTPTPAAMSSRTALNTPYRGLVEAMAIPAELHERAGRVYASFGGAVPIHCCTPEEVEEYANRTHHYCDLFTEQTLAPLGELAYVRLDEATAEKVFINRAKRLLLVSSDGKLAQWRAAPSFESANQFVAGTPVVDQQGALVSLVTARRGNHYAVSTFDGAGGYFETPTAWSTVDTPAGALVYGERHFESRDELRAYVDTLPPAEVGPGVPATPVLQLGSASPRVLLVTRAGRQLAHHYLPHVQARGVQYL